jgi:hypothetical protein
MRSSDYKAANVQIQIALLVDHAAQLVAGPSANRHINIQFLSARRHDAVQTCRGCEALQKAAGVELRCRVCSNPASYSRVSGFISSPGYLPFSDLSHPSKNQDNFVGIEKG